jgi:hypothetical protein
LKGKGSTLVVWLSLEQSEAAAVRSSSSQNLSRWSMRVRGHCEHIRLAGRHDIVGIYR